MKPEVERIRTVPRIVAITLRRDEPRIQRGFRFLTIGALVGVLAGFAFAAPTSDDVRLECIPRTFEVVPGQPMRLELTVRSDSAARIRFHIPGDRRLKLRVLEKLPLRRTPEGVIVHRRIVVWQGLEPGTITMKTLSVETQGRKRLFPEVTITVRDPGP